MDYVTIFSNFMPENMGWLAIVFALILAAVSGLFGYKLMRFFIGVSGLALGFVVGYTLTAHFTSNVWIALLIGLIAGIVICMLAFKLYIAGVFILTAFMTASAVDTLIQSNAWWAWVLAIAAGILVGIIATKFIRPVVILSTSLSAGVNIVSIVAAGILNNTNPAIPLIGGVVLGLVIAVIQFTVTGKETEE